MGHPVYTYIFAAVRREHSLPSTKKVLNEGLNCIGCLKVKIQFSTNYEMNKCTWTPVHTAVFRTMCLFSTYSHFYCGSINNWYPKKWHRGAKVSTLHRWEFWCKLWWGRLRIELALAGSHTPHYLSNRARRRNVWRWIYKSNQTT